MFICVYIYIYISYNLYTHRRLTAAMRHHGDNCQRATSDAGSQHASTEISIVCAVSRVQGAGFQHATTKTSTTVQNYSTPPPRPCTLETSTQHLIHHVQGDGKDFASNIKPDALRCDRTLVK